MPNRVKDTGGNFIDPVGADELNAAIAAALGDLASDADLLAAVQEAVGAALGNVATDEELATALQEALDDLPEVGDTFVTNLYESNYFVTQILNQPDGLPKLDSNGKVGKGQTRYVDAAVSFILGDGVSVVPTGKKGYVRVPFAATITSVDLIADQAGSIVVDIWKDTFANSPPTAADSITASAKPTLSSASKGSDSTLTGWNKSIAAGDVIAVNVDSASTLTLVTLVINMERS